MTDYHEFVAKEVTTRKPSWCEWCGQDIAAHERAYYRSYKWDGRMVSAHMHLECKQGWEKSDPELLAYGWLPENRRGEPLL